MKITLSNFESVIDHTVLKRGQEYWRQGLVQDLEEVKDGNWTALVEGTDTYEVRVSISDNTVTDYRCTCPYDLGPVCKHEVAMIYAIESCLAEGIAIDIKERGKHREKTKSKRKTEKRGRKTILQKLEETLDNMSQEEIVGLVRNYSLENREFRNIILARFTPHSKENGKSTYRQLVKESLRMGTDRHGSIGYWGAGRAVRGAEELLDKGEKLMENGEPEQAIPIFQTVIEELVPALQYADDSSGSIGGAIEWAFEELYQCSKKIKDLTASKDSFGTLSSALFDYCLSEAGDKKYADWDWKWHFLTIAGELVSTEEQKQLFSKLDETVQKEQSYEFSKYGQERAAEIKLGVIMRSRSQEEVDQFINHNLQHTPIRRQAIEQAFNNKDLRRVKELAKQGIKQEAERQHPGLVNEWCNWLLKLAEVENNVEDVREYTRTLFFQNGDFEYYEKLKKTYSKSVWADQFVELLRDIKKSKNVRGVHFDTMAEMFIREKEWQRLFDLVKTHPSFATLDRYHKHLGPHFPQELIHMYEKISKELLVHTTGRATYEDVCRMLRRMKKLGADDRVKGLVKEFSEKYKNRRALLEELAKV